MKKIKFDEALERLEELMLELERGDLGLEESIKTYEKGMELALACQKILTEAESKISLLNEKTNGEFEVKPIQWENQADVSDEKE